MNRLSRPTFDVFDCLVGDKFVNNLAAGVEALISKDESWCTVNTGILSQVMLIKWFLVSVW